MAKINIEKSFQQYLGKVIPEGAILPDVQMTEMKRAFYAGFGACFIEFQNIDEEEMSKEGSLKYFTSIHDQVLDFWKAEERKVANGPNDEF